MVQCAQQQGIGSMAKEAFQLSDDAVTAYEDQKVRAMFGPLARVTLATLSINEEDTILDLACGTGIVSRSILKTVVPNSPMTGVDLNAGMIKKAKELTHTEASNYDWHVADAEDLPFDAGAFSLIICQQGIQYFPNQQAVLKELHRVSAKPGKLVISVWAGASDFFEAMAASVGQHVDHETGQKYLGPFSYKDVDVLPDMLTRAGFKEVEVKKLTVDRTMENISSNILGEILGHPAGQKVKDAGKLVVQAISSEVIAACSKYQSGNDMIVPQQAYLFTATA